MSPEKTELAQALKATWELNQRINSKLLSWLEDDWLKFRYAPRVRTIGKTFSHLHQVRLMWLGSDPSTKIPDRIRPKNGLTTELLSEHLNDSATAISKMIERIVEKGKVTGFKGGAADFMGYLVAHEAHHRGQILVSLRLNDCKIHQNQALELWEWGKI